MEDFKNPWKHCSSCLKCPHAGEGEEMAVLTCNTAREQFRPINLTSEKSIKTYSVFLES